MSSKKNELELKAIQDIIMKKLKSESNDVSFDALFSSDVFSLVSLNNGIATFITETESSKQFIINSQYPEKIKEELERITSDNYEIEIISKSSYKQKEEQQNKKIDDKKVFPNCVLLPTYTFENFVTGSSNKQAYLASLQAVDYPGKYNPIFIYSKSGLGKTHLLYAIGNKFKSKYPQKKIQYITSNVFIDTIVNHFRNDQSYEVETIKNYFYGVDLLLIDDIQFLADKKTIQMIFFDIFNLLVTTGKQIVITSDRSPIELKGLEDRLVTRFSGGLSLNMTPPDKKTLKDILKLKIETQGLDLSTFDEDALDYLAMKHSKSIRELEGALTTLLFNIATIKPSGNIDLNFVQNVFSDETKIIEKKGQTSINSIIDDVSEYYSLTSSQLRSKVRTSQIALARQIAMYLSRTVLNLPYQVIGREFQKDHSTVLANVQKIEDNIKKDKNLEKTINELKKIVVKQN